MEGESEAQRGESRPAEEELGRDHLLAELRAAELERQRAIAEHKRRSDVVRLLILDGRKAGIPMTHMAEASGITRENLYQMIGPIRDRM